MGVAPSAAAMAALESALSKVKPPPRSSKIAAASTLALALAVICPITVYAVVRDPPMTASELIILRALVDYAADKAGEKEDVIWRELHQVGAAERRSLSVSQAEWRVSVKYLVSRIGAD